MSARSISPTHQEKGISHFLEVGLRSLRSVGIHSPRKDTLEGGGSPERSRGTSEGGNPFWVSPSEFEAHRGQALLLVLFAMAVVLTVALLPLSRSVSDISITEKEDEASRAFSAAEAGLERVLIGEDLAGGTSIGEASVVSHTAYIGAGQTHFVYPEDLTAGQTATLWFVGHNPDGSLVCGSPDNDCYTGNTLRICWGTANPESSAQTPAIEVTLVHLPTWTGSSPGPTHFAVAQVKRWTADPVNTRRSENHFAAAAGNDTCDSTKSFFYSYPISSNLVPAGRKPVLAQITFYYNSTQKQGLAFQVSGSGDGGNLPPQGEVIQSKATLGSTTQTVQATRSFPVLPSLFTAVLATDPAAGGSITKQPPTEEPEVITPVPTSLTPAPTGEEPEG